MAIPKGGEVYSDDEVTSVYNGPRITFYDKNIKITGTVLFKISEKYFGDKYNHNSREELQTWVNEIAKRSGEQVDLTYLSGTPSVIGYQNLEKIRDTIKSMLPALNDYINKTKLKDVFLEYEGEDLLRQNGASQHCIEDHRNHCDQSKIKKIEIKFEPGTVHFSDADVDRMKEVHYGGHRPR